MSKKTLRKKPKNTRRTQYVIYTCSSWHGEVLICTPANEKKVLTEWFAPETGRELDDYDRKECSESAAQVLVSSHITSS